jgi:hypothetical protein
VRTNPVYSGVIRLSLTGCVHGPFFPADGDVSAKIAEELAYEKEATISAEPAFLKEFKDSGIWTVYLCCFFVSSRSN